MGSNALRVSNLQGGLSLGDSLGFEILGAKSPQISLLLAAG